MNADSQHVIDAIARLNEDILLAQPRYQDPRSLARFRAQVYSQNGEDGAIAEIFNRIGIKDKFFVEIGVGDGSQNNTRFLLETGWHGIWWEGDHSNCNRIRANYLDELSSGQLVLIENLIDVENAKSGLVSAGCPTDFDLLSIDIDMNTSHVWNALLGFKPRAAVIEYNANIPPSVSWEVKYHPRAMWTGGNRFGASLKRLEDIGKQQGYALVGCELTGINAYFVGGFPSNDSLGPSRSFLEPFTAEHHYEPPRFQFMFCSRGHPPAGRP